MSVQPLPADKVHTWDLVEYRGRMRVVLQAKREGAVMMFELASVDAPVRISVGTQTPMRVQRDGKPAIENYDAPRSRTDGGIAYHPVRRRRAR